MDLRDRARACLLGGAIGDALGYPIEFERGPFPDAPIAFEGVVSDDTQMTMFTAEGLLDTGTLEAIHDAYQRWLRTQAGYPSDVGMHGLLEIPALWVRRAPGNTCLTALMQNAHFDRLPSTAAPPNDSKGCGAVMRSAPFGLWCKTRDEAFTLAKDAGVLTHGHPSGYLSAAFFASLVFDLARGASFDAALDHATKLLVAQPSHAETLAAVEAARAVRGVPDRAALEALGGGWVGEEALAIAIACASSDNDVRSALWRAVAHGGDSDSTGSLTGNLLGAMLGMKALPDDWLQTLEMRDAIDELAQRLVSE